MMKTNSDTHKRNRRKRKKKKTKQNVQYKFKHASDVFREDTGTIGRDRDRKSKTKRALT